MRLALVSDTHGYHDEVAVPDADVLIHAGDFCRRGTLEEVERFADWLGQQPHKTKIVIAGNHDWPFQREPALARRVLAGTCVYLEDASYEHGGLKFWGSPWQPWFLNWAFNVQRGPDLAAIWAKIPVDTDVLITHGPPAGVLDMTAGGDSTGCADLLERVVVVRPKLHVFGHIHEAAGVEERDGTIFVNASCDEGLEPARLVEL